MKRAAKVEFDLTQNVRRQIVAESRWLSAGPALLTCSVGIGWRRVPRHAGRGDLCLASTSYRAARDRETSDYERRWKPHLGPTTGPGCVCEREGEGRRSRGPRESSATPRALGRRDLSTTGSLDSPGPAAVAFSLSLAVARPSHAEPSPSGSPAPLIRSRAHAPAAAIGGVSYVVSFRNPEINNCSEESKRSR